MRFEHQTNVLLDQHSLSSPPLPTQQHEQIMNLLAAFSLVNLDVFRLVRDASHRVVFGAMCNTTPGLGFACAYCTSGAGAGQVCDSWPKLLRVSRWLDVASYWRHTVAVVGSPVCCSPHGNCFASRPWWARGHVRRVGACQVLPGFPGICLHHISQARELVATTSCRTVYPPP